MERPVWGAGGGFEFIGHHEILIPILAAAAHGKQSDRRRRGFGRGAAWACNGNLDREAPPIRPWPFRWVDVVDPLHEHWSWPSQRSQACEVSGSSKECGRRAWIAGLLRLGRIDVAVSRKRMPTRLGRRGSHGERPPPAARRARRAHRPRSRRGKKVANGGHRPALKAHLLSGKNRQNSWVSSTHHSI